VAWLFHLCSMTHSYVWHDSFICVPRPIHTRHESCSHVCDVTHLYMWHASFMHVTWLVRTCERTGAYIAHDAFICVAGRLNERNTTHSHVCVICLDLWHVLFIDTIHRNTLLSTLIHRNTLQHTATHCNTIEYTATHCKTLQNSATLPHTAMQKAESATWWYDGLAYEPRQQDVGSTWWAQHTAMHCNKLQGTVKTLQHTLQHAL